MCRSMRVYQAKLAHYNPDHANGRRTSCQETLLVENSESIYKEQTRVEYAAQEEECHLVVVTNNLQTWSDLKCGKQRDIPWISFRRPC